VHETFELLGRLRESNTPAVMATLVRAKGTTPRKEGAKMFVGSDGSIFGSITIGGCVDARVIENAHAILDSAVPRLLHFDLGDEEAWEIGLTCGGKVEVLLEPVTDALLTTYGHAHREWQAGRAVAIATEVASGSRTLAALDAKSTDSIYVEHVQPPRTIAIFGASAVAIPLTSFARSLGLRSIVIDGRERFATRKRFPDADELRVGMVSEIAGALPMNANTAVVLVAHDYKIDVPVLKQALAGDAPYIGLLGSRRRGAAILQLLRDEGIAGEALTRIRVPIGLDLGGETAGEIALSIIAEVVAVLHGRNGAPLHARP
jgi:xanthine dehydrogenase accessory factor